MQHSKSPPLGQPMKPLVRLMQKEWVRTIGGPLLGLVALIVLPLLYITSSQRALEEGGATLVRSSGAAPPDMSEVGEFICEKGRTFKDFGTTFPDTTKRECASLCYHMPDCVVWSHRPANASSLLRVQQGTCHVFYTNGTAVLDPESEACVQLSHRELDMPRYLGMSHWQGCYFKTQRPFLLDGARQIERMGPKVIKVSLNFHAPWDDYPWHSNWTANGYENWKTWTPDPVDMAKHPYFRELLDMSFETFILVVYSSVERSTGPPEWRAWGDPWYWIYKDPSEAQLKEESRQFYELAHYLASTYRDKTFILQNWEGDWMWRMDLQEWQKWDWSTPVAPEKAQRMIKWLGARQDGVTRARRSLGRRAKSKIYHGAEVNLVKKTVDDLEETGHAPRIDMVNAVLPYVAQDMVSYSCYDSALAMDANKGGLYKSFKLIQKMHKRTPASPERPVFVGEFGVDTMNRDWDDSMERVKNTLNIAAAAGFGMLVYWQIFDNVLNNLGKEHYGVERCDSRLVASGKGPVRDQKYIYGFFVQHPDMMYYRPTSSWLYWKIQGCPPNKVKVDGECVESTYQD